MVSNATCGVCQAPLRAGAQVCPQCGTPVDYAAAGSAPAASARVSDPPPWADVAATPDHAAANGTAAPGDAVPADAVAPVPDAVAASGPAPVGGTPTAWMPLPAAAAPSAPAALPPPVWSREAAVAAPAPAPAAPPPPAVTPIAYAPAPAVAPAAGELISTAPPPPTGALILLPDEDVIMQLGALYLTNKRAILYAPTILRSAFLRDIDAVGTVTERSSGWMLLLALLALALTAAALYAGLAQPGLELKVGDVYSASPLLLAIPLAIIGVLTLASYFFWVKRSLFLSVGGRPLIVVSISGWSGRKLTTVDAFVNAFSQAKDAAGR